MTRLKDKEIYLNNLGQRKANLSIAQRYGSLKQFNTFSRVEKNKRKLGTIIRRGGSTFLIKEYQYWVERELGQ